MLAGRVVPGHVSGAEGLDEGVVGGGGLGGSKPGEGVDSALLEGLLGELGDDAVELVAGDLGRHEVHAIVANAGGDPLGVDVLVGVDADGAVESDAVEDALQTGLVPVAGLVGLVFLDEPHGAKRTVDLEAVVTVHHAISTRTTR